VQALQNGLDQAESISQVVSNRVPDHSVREMEIIRASTYRIPAEIYIGSFVLTCCSLLVHHLGAIIRKGGLGLPVVIAVVFFLVYHILSTVAEKSAKEGSLDPVFGMWTAILIILTPLGISF
jgi:lipopolysaccharide export system permease protein